MAKLQEGPITATDIRTFADGCSDFGFELRVLALLHALGVNCEHGGTYDDPVTDKPRQFDIRAFLDIGEHRVRFAIECKNLRENFPLVVFTIPRIENESYHEVVFSHKPKEDSRMPAPFANHGTRLCLEREHCFYSVGDNVGKSCSQVGKGMNGKLTGNDSEVYDKWHQAIHSAHDLVDRANKDWGGREGNGAVTFVLPVLVVPNERLWEIAYTPDGSHDGDPQQVDRSCYYIDKFVASSDRFAGIPVRFSHLEILTENGLAKMCDDLLNGDLSKKAFSREGIGIAIGKGE